MSREFPDWVNPWKAAEGNRIYRGTIALAKMNRLAPLLAGTEGEVEFSATFSLDGMGWTTVDLEVRANLPLVCQASLERFLLPVERKTTLAVIGDLRDQDRVPGHYEATWTETGQLVFLEIVQDELILGIPQVPRKPGTGEIQYSTDPDEEQELRSEERNRPFAALGDLIRGERNETDED